MTTEESYLVEQGWTRVSRHAFAGQILTRWAHSDHSPARGKTFTRGAAVKHQQLLDAGRKCECAAVAATKEKASHGV